MLSTGHEKPARKRKGREVKRSTVIEASLLLNNADIVNPRKIIDRIKGTRNRRISDNVPR